MREVTAAIIYRDSQVLIARRGPESKLAGFWEFPGGKVEKGETRQQCLERELNEELGVETEVGEEIAESEYHYDHGSFLIIAIEATLKSSDIVLKEHDRIEWVQLADLDKYKLAPADIPLAKSVRQKYEKND